MNINTENLKNLLEKHQESSIEEQKIQKLQEVIKYDSGKEKIKLKYSPQKVEYFNYNNYLYRREVDAQNNVSWEIVKGNITFKIEHQIQIQNLEKKYYTDI